MRTIRTVADLRAHLRETRERGATVGLVPTMGALHAGHLTLIEAAAAACDEVVMSLFVNPAQFDQAADLAAYPRDEAADAELADRAGATLLFAPPLEEVYPGGFSTTVSVGGLGDVLEGEHRPGHFAGVATVVTKLLNMVGPDVAYFGQKDAQQATLIRKLVRDLDIPARIEVLPTVREADGLALSSRNARLSAEERERALGISRGLRAAAAAGRQATDPGALEAAVRAELGGLDVEYVAVVDPETFSPLATLNGRALVAVAARAGATRLIDNVLIETTTGERSP
jgi:pantoate--beta-alanine ligase